MKQNKNLLSSRLTENRIDNQNIIQSNRNLSNQKSSAPISDKKQYKTWGKRKKKEEPAYFQYADSSNLTDRNLEDYAEIRDNTKMKRGNLHTRIINFILIAGCIYLLVLIFGAAVTKYQYNSDGKAVPEKMSVDDIRQKHNFDTILTQYEYCRSLYEKTLVGRVTYYAVPVAWFLPFGDNELVGRLDSESGDLGNMAIHIQDIINVYVLNTLGNGFAHRNVELYPFEEAEEILSSMEKEGKADNFTFPLYEKYILIFENIYVYEDCRNKGCFTALMKMLYEYYGDIRMVE